MKIRTILIIMLLALIPFGCNSPGVREKPDNQQEWIKCRFCKGTGYMTVLSYDKSPDDVTGNKESKNDFIAAPFCLLGSIFSHGDNQFPEYDSSSYEKDKYTNNYSEKNVEATKNNIPERSTVKKRIKCPHCEGTGWVIWQ